MTTSTTPYSYDQLNALRAAYAAGATSVEYNGKRVQYRTLEEMERLIAVIERELSGSTAKRFSLASFSRG
jgi:hypothetical protein